MQTMQMKRLLGWKIAELTPVICHGTPQQSEITWSSLVSTLPTLKLSAVVKVPLTVVRGRIYGAYGMSLEAGFNPVDSLLLRRGWTLAFAHVRGGGELGRRWHHAGRQLGKSLALQVYLNNYEGGPFHSPPRACGAACNQRVCMAVLLKIFFSGPRSGQ